jgi:hypothetical protein
MNRGADGLVRSPVRTPNSFAERDRSPGLAAGGNARAPEGRFMGSGLFLAELLSEHEPNNVQRSTFN